MSVPMVLHHPPSLGEVVEGESDTLTPSRLDTFLSTLGEAEPVSGEEEEGEEGESRLISTAVDKGIPAIPPPAQLLTDIQLCTLLS